MGCFIVAIFIAILDIGIKYLSGGSLFNMAYEEQGYFLLTFWWAIASFVTGMIGVSLDILQPSIAGCIGVAVSWSLLVTVFTGKGVTTPPSPERDDEGGEE
jgi:uncharacterized membrane protein